MNEFFRSAPCARGKVDPVVRQLSIPWKEAACGTKTLKLSNREKMEIPNVVRTVIASRIVDSTSSTVRKPVSSHMGGQPSLQYFTGMYKNKIMIQNQKKSEKRKNNWVFYILLSHVDITKICLMFLSLNYFSLRLD